ncbi:MAG: SDR family NAD(P)-dependent oxidoreductase [Lysobacterales bacterium]|nr:MAG: SDR family NAD(P)-dependent oxidoreductase [Xanthomonadales bacterium]
MSQHRTSFSRRLIAFALAGFALVATLPPSPAAAQAERLIVSGASGNLGGLTVDELLARGVPASRLILVSRTPEELKKYADRGASVRFGDFTKPESLPAAYAGGTRMLLISVGASGGVTAPALLKRAIDAAKAAGVKHIAYTSYVGITRGDMAGRAADHAATEVALKQSGLQWTMLRNSIYMHGLIGQAQRMVADGRAVVPPNESPIGYITREDCARAAAAVLATPGHEGKAYDITGSELIGVRQTAAAASAVTGKPITVVQGGSETRAGFGRPEMAFTTTHFEQLTGGRPTTLRQLFQANKATLLTPPAR